MSKIICDVCGTAYPDTASQCPICGCARPDHPQAAAGNSAGEQVDAGGGYTYVKGGRFSKSNVRRRNQGAGPAPRREARQPMDMDEKPVDQDEASGLNPVIIAVVILIVAILLIVAFIAVRFFAPGLFSGTPDNESTGSTTTAATSEPTSQPTSEPGVIPCTDMILTDTEITLDGRGRSWTLNPLPQPSDTTDQVVYTTSDENVAIVTTSGQVTAVGSGTATITVTCGTVTKQVTVTCTVESTSEPTNPPTSEPTNPPTSEPTEPPTSAPAGFKLNRDDFTMFAKGEQWDVYDGSSVGRDNITWTSNDENVCTVSRGIVTAVGPGNTTVVAEYQGQKLTCIVRVRITLCTDITLPEVEIKLEGKGNSYTLKPVLTPSGASEPVTYTSSDDKVVVVSDSGVITAVGNGTATVTVTCGSVSKTVNVTCEFKEAATDPSSTASTTAPTTASGTN